MDAEFEKWWNEYALPKIQTSPGNFLLMQHIDDLKNAAKECWQAAWLAAKKSQKA